MSSFYPSHRCMLMVSHVHYSQHPVRPREGNGSRGHEDSLCRENVRTDSMQMRGSVVRWQPTICTRRSSVCTTSGDFREQILGPCANLAGDECGRRRVMDEIN